MSADRVIAKQEGNTHHLLLTDGVSTMGLTFCNPDGTLNDINIVENMTPSTGFHFYQGLPEYADYSPPFHPTQFDDWSQGRGVASHYKNTTGYYDGRAAWTSKESEFIPGGFPMYTYIDEKYELWERHEAGDKVHYYNMQLSSGYERMATQFTIGGSNWTPKYITIVCQYMNLVDEPANDLTVSICADSSGSPGAVVGNNTVTISTSDLDAPYTLQEISKTISSPTQLTASTTYWIVAQSADSSFVAGWQPFSVYDYTGITSKTWLSGYGWLATDADLMYRIDGTRNDFKGHFFELRGAWLMAKEMNDGTASTLWLNGDWGVANGTQNSSYLVDDTKTWTASEWVGCVCKLTRKTGTRQVQTWRLITANTSDTLTVSPIWGETPVDTETEYVILGSDKWTEIPTNGAAKDPPDWDGNVSGNVLTVNDVHVVNGIAYFSHGDDDNMTSLSCDNASGTWNLHWVDETAALGYLEDSYDQNGAFIVGITQGVPSQWYICESPNSGYGSGANTALTWGSANSNWDIGERAQNTITYGDYGQCWCIKERSAWQMIDRKFYKTSPAEMGNTADDRNGEAVMVKGVYLFWSHKTGAVRYFRNNLDGINPNKAEYGLPEDRRGYISAMEAYPGLEIYAFDAGNDGVSHILAHNGFGFFELYRAPQTGRRIHGMKVQSIPGANVDRLWFTCGSDIVWIPIATDPYNHEQIDYNFYPFIWAGSLTTAYVYLKRRSVQKLFKELEANIEKGSSDYFMHVNYRVDDDTSWTYLGKFSSWSSDGAIQFSSAYDVTGTRIQLQFILSQVVTNRYCAKLVAAVLEAFAKFKKATLYTTTVLVEDNAITYDGDMAETFTTASSKMTKLEEWDENPTALLASATLEQLDGKYIALDKNKLDVLQVVNDSKYVVKISFFLLE